MKADFDIKEEKRRKMMTVREKKSTKAAKKNQNGNKKDTAILSLGGQAAQGLEIFLQDRAKVVKDGALHSLLRAMEGDGNP